MSTAVVMDTKTQVLQPLSFEEQKAKQEFLAKLASGDVSVLPQLTALIDRENKIKEARKETLAGTIQAIVKFDMTFEELADAQHEGKPLFSESTVRAYVQSKGWIKSNTTSGEEKVKRTRTLREGTLIFSIQPPGAVGGATKIMKEDDFPIQGIGAKAVWLFKEPGDMTKKLMECAVPEAKEFLATPEGKEFTKKWAEWIKKEAPNFKPKAK